MEERTKKPRGRPRIHPKDLMDETVKNNDCTRRCANNKLLGNYAFAVIGENTPEDTQRYFFGGRTLKEALAGKPKLFCVRAYIMQELGRHPKEMILRFANYIAHNPALRDWTQQEIVDKLKSSRLNEV
jgi:hypothetical protein